MKLTELLDEIDRLDQEVTKGPWTSIGNDFGGKVYDPSGYPLPGCTSCGENEATYEGQDAEFIALARIALPQLAKALRAVIADCDETIESANKYGMADMHLMGQGAQARATRRVIAKTPGADHDHD